jgi:hypothetical protein
MLRFDWANFVRKTRMSYRRQIEFLALVLTSFVLAGAAQPVQAQYIQQGPKLVGTNGSTDALQGFSVALSGDGNTALVGGPYDNSQAGAVWVYARSGGVWAQQGSKLTVTDNVSNARFGWAVALSADGNTALIGGPADNTMFGGAAWVFTRSGGVWSEQAKLTANDLGRYFGVTVLQGASVALSADGNTAVVGAPQDASLTGGGGMTGVAVVFIRSAGVWGEQQRIAGSVNGMIPAASQGTSVALSADGNTAAVGAPGYNNGNPSDGAVFIITRSNGVWSQQGGALIGTGATNGGSHQGQSVALSADGTTLLEGGNADNGGGAQSGAAWAFTRSGSAWSQQSGKLFLPATSATQQGQSVALSANGNVGIVGAPGSGPGQVLVYARSGGTWSQQGGSLQGTGGDGNTAQGSSVALSADGNTMLEGGDNFNNGVGAAWVFRRSVNTHDFNDDGMSDIAWRDTSGNVAVWLLNGATPVGLAALGTIPTVWSIVGQRDFDGDRDADLLWRNNTSGDTVIWFMSGTQMSSSAYIGNIPSTWSVIATGDFNGDGKGDILWRDGSGNVAVWLMNGGAVSSSAGLGNVPTQTWAVVGAGDYNGDGMTDLLWRDTGGNIAIWFMNGTQVASSAGLGNIPTSWSVVGSGDFNGDGKGDIVWRNSNGDTSIWLMNGASLLSGVGIGNVPAPLWSIVQTGDYDGNGISDLLWRDTNGNTVIWFMNGATVASTGGLGTIPPIWTVQSASAE